MIMLPVLMDFDVNDAQSTETWSLNHSDDHDDIREAIQTQKNVNLADWVLYPFTVKDWDAYAIRHQSAHNDMNSTLGLSGSDLTDVDLTDPKAAEYWNFEHFREHQAARAALGI